MSEWTLQGERIRRSEEKFIVYGRYAGVAAVAGTDFYLSERFVEVIAVESGNLVKLRADAHVVVKHQVDQSFAID